jgi:hypothetical protein
MRIGEGRASGVSRDEGLGTTGFGKPGEGEEISKAQRGEISRRYAHVACETTLHVVGLAKSEEFLATTDRGNGRRDGRQLEMTEDTRDHRLLGNSGNDPERAASAQGTRGTDRKNNVTTQPGTSGTRGVPKKTLLRAAIA